MFKYTNMDIIRVVVINLPENTERLAEMKKNWSIPFSVSPGVVHSIQHSGCGLAHVNAVRLGLAGGAPACIVLEDDAQFLGDFAQLNTVIRDIVACSEQWDAVVIGVEGDGANRVPQTAVRVHPHCLQLCPSEVPSQTHCVLWSRSALPLLAEYESLLLTNTFLPIDRFLFMNSWHHGVWARWEPVPSAIDTKLFSWKSPKNDLMWNTPRTWVCDVDAVVFNMVQNVLFHSDHTGKSGGGYTNKHVTRTFLTDLAERAEVGNGRPATPAMIRHGRNPTGRTAFIACTARDVETSFAKESLEIILAAFDDYSFLVVESNSTDATLKTLQRFCNIDPVRRRMISLSPDGCEMTRTQRIARARNVYVDAFKASGFPLLVVVDVDGALDVDMNFSDQLQSCLKRDDWDYIASNRRGPYYDTWALRSELLGVTFDACEEYDMGRMTMNDYPFNMTIEPSREWIPCESAFGCLALYRRTPNLYNGDTTCEHVSFNVGLRGFIVPYLMSGGVYEFSDGIFTDIIPANRWL